MEKEYKFIPSKYKEGSGSSIKFKEVKMEDIPMAPVSKHSQTVEELKKEVKELKDELKKIKEDEIENLKKELETYKNSKESR